MIEILLHRCFLESRPDLTAWYRWNENGSILELKKFKGYRPEKSILKSDDESIQFIMESGQSASIINAADRPDHPFKGILLNRKMQGGFAVTAGNEGIFFFNFLHPYRFTFKNIVNTEELIKTAGGPYVLDNE